MRIIYVGKQGSWVGSWESKAEKNVDVPCIPGGS